MRLFERILYRIYLRTSWSGPTKHIKRFVSKLACPYNADEHFWHDGCVECSFDDKLCSGCNTIFTHKLENYSGCCSRECMEYMIYSNRY